jgi:hypothetical protein
MAALTKVHHDLFPMSPVPPITTIFMISLLAVEHPE